MLAAQFPLLRIGATATAAKDPAKLQLLAKKDELEQQIDKLKYEKAAIPPDEYKKQLGALLLQLAQTQEEIDK
jgi:protein-arginine kinase activator protein McsA